MAASAISPAVFQNSSNSTITSFQVGWSSSPTLPKRLATMRFRMTETTDPDSCPLCNLTLAGEDFYGPCEQCRANLRERFAGEQREVVAEAYEPKMNVTPNAVALKE